jgi:hypothetical protein
MINLQLVDTTTHNNNNNKNCNTKEEVSKVFLEYSKRQEKLCQLKIEPFVIFFFKYTQELHITVLRGRYKSLLHRALNTKY